MPGFRTASQAAEIGGDGPTIDRLERTASGKLRPFLSRCPMRSTVEFLMGVYGRTDFVAPPRMTLRPRVPRSGCARRLKRDEIKFDLIML